MLKGKKVNEYLKQFKASATQPARSGFVAVYEVSGSTQEMEEYAAAQGENLKTDPDTGKVLFWSPNGSGDQNIDIVINARTGAARENNEFQNEARKVFIKAGTLGAEVLQATAQEFAKHTVSNLFASRRTASAGSIVVAEPAKAVEPAKTPAGAVDELEG